MKRLNIFFGAAALIAVTLTASPNLNAQENGNRDMDGSIVRGPYETNRFGDNWFIGAGGGVNLLWNKGYDVKIGPSIDANIGKWFTPAIGMRIGYQGISSQVSAPDNSLQKYGYMYFHGDFLWNASDGIGGYKQTRFWDLVPYAHAGFFRSYGLSDSDFSNNELAAGAGLLHMLRLADRLDLIIDMRATVMYGRVINNSGIAVLPSVTAGLAVDLGWPNFTRTSSVIGAVELANLEKERGNPEYCEESSGLVRSASDEMCIFLIINISSLQLIPITMIAYRSQYGSVDPTRIVVPGLIATSISTLTAIIFCKWMERRNR